MRPYNPENCQLALFPVVFGFDLGQTAVYTPLLIWLLCKYYRHMSGQVKAMLIVFGVALAMRPSMILACQVNHTDPYQCLQYLWLNDLTFYVLFYYIVFKMLVLVIAMDHWKD